MAFYYFFLLEYSRFAMLCGLLYSKRESTVHIHISSLFQFPFHFNLHRALSPLCSTVVYLLFISYIVVCVCGNPSTIRVLLSGSVHSFNNSTYWSLCARLCAKRLIDRLSLNPCITFSLQRKWRNSSVFSECIAEPGRIRRQPDLSACARCGSVSQVKGVFSLIFYPGC